MDHDLAPVFSRVESYRDEMAQSLSRLIQVPCIRDAGDAGPGPEGAQVLAVAREMSEQCGLTYREVAGQVGVAEMGQGDGVVGALLHLDVVPPGADWQHPPFSGLIIDGEVWGRGAQDDKGPTVSVLYAARAVREGAVPLARTFRILLGTDEETGVWRDIDAYLAEETAPLMSFVPDGEFPITCGEKGFCNVAITMPAVPEEAGDAPRLEALVAGERSNVVPDRATAALMARRGAAGLLEQLEERCARFRKQHEEASLSVRAGEGADGIVVEALGRAAHGSTPEKGHSAFLDLVALLSDVPLADSAAARMVRFVTEAVGFDLSGGGLGLRYEHDFTGQTTVNIGLVTVLEDGGCKAVANVRMPIGLSQLSVLNGVAAAANAFAGRTGAPVDVRQEGRGHEPLYVDPEGELVRGLARAYQQATGLGAKLRSTGGTTFAKSMPNCVAFGAAMDDDPPLYHRADERTSVDVLVRNGRIYAAAIVELCGA